MVSISMCSISVYSTLFKMAVYQRKKGTIEILLGQVQIVFHFMYFYHMVPRWDGMCLCYRDSLVDYRICCKNNK